MKRGLRGLRERTGREQHNDRRRQRIRRDQLAPVENFRDGKSPRHRTEQDYTGEHRKPAPYRDEKALLGRASRRCLFRRITDQQE